MQEPFIFYRSLDCTFVICCFFLNLYVKPIPSTPRRASYITLTPFLFAIIAGYLPVLRSVVMFSFVAVGYQLRRTVNIYHIDRFSTINFTFSTLPADVSFQLSYLALFFYRLVSTNNSLYLLNQK
jgi:competence protein ComEC